ncbi:MAG: serine/threonine-protein kinase [Planctomycetota bacterium]
MPMNDVLVEHVLTKRQLSESYLAFHSGLGIHMELRVVKPEIVQQIGENGFQDLRKCCQHYARVRHPNLTAVFDMGTFGPFPYTLNEYTTGIPLHERLKERPLSEGEALKIMVPIADGLAALWRTDFVHRGVSPHRILVGADGVPKLDIVIFPRVPLDPVIIEAHAPFMAGFWPPEELRQSGDIDARSDMFSFGAALYYALIGTSPFGKGSRTEIMARTLMDPPKDPRASRPDLKPGICEFIMRCLKTNPKERFGSTSEFMDALYELRLQTCNQVTQRFSTFSPILTSSQSQSKARSVFGPGDTIGQCVLEEKVGQGAFGVVYKARHQLLDIPVAIKFLPGELADKSPEYIDLFLREARTAIRIRHKHVIGIYEAGQQGGQYFLMMEFAPNGSVLDRLQRSSGSLPEEDVIRIMRETALGLAAAAEVNIIHRDIKPANLMFGAQNEIKVADLGLAKRVSRPESSDQLAASIKAEQLTMLRGEQTIQGTPDYMAPETATAPDSVDIRADLYSLGITAYHLLTGRVPFDGNAPLQVIMKHVTQIMIPPRQHMPSVSPKLEAIIMRLVEKNPEDRFQTPMELAAALGAVK